MRIILIASLIAAAMLSGAAHGNDALPWDPEVRIADENLDEAVMPPDEKKPDLMKRGDAACAPDARQKIRHRTVYSGPQAGAFFLIRFFQIVISPQDGPNCRFDPVCSAYGRRAVELHGGLLGAMLAGERILRCNPYSPPGHDPVPDQIFPVRGCCNQSGPSNRRPPHITGKK